MASNEQEKINQLLDKLDQLKKEKLRIDAASEMVHAKLDTLTEKVNTWEQKYADEQGKVFQENLTEKELGSVNSDTSEEKSNKEPK